MATSGSWTLFYPHSKVVGTLLTAQCYYSILITPFLPGLMVYRVTKSGARWRPLSATSGKVAATLSNIRQGGGHSQQNPARWRPLAATSSKEGARGRLVGSFCRPWYESHQVRTTGAIFGLCADVGLVGIYFQQASHSPCIYFTLNCSVLG